MHAHQCDIESCIVTDCTCYDLDYRYHDHDGGHYHIPVSHSRQVTDIIVDSKYTFTDCTIKLCTHTHALKYYDNHKVNLKKFLCLNQIFTKNGKALLFVKACVISH